MPAAPPSTEQVLPSQRSGVRKTRDWLAQKIWEKDRQSTVRLVLTVVNVILVLLLGGLTFSPSWPPPLSITLWSTAGALVLLLLVGAWVDYDVTTKEKSERQKAATAKNALEGKVNNLNEALADSSRRLSRAKAELGKAVQAHNDYDRAIKGALLPLAGILEQIPLARTSREAEGLLGEFKSLAITMLYQTAGTSNQKLAARATLYEIDDQGNPIYRRHGGRAEQPRDRFEGESLTKIRKLIDTGATNWFDVDDPFNSVEPSKGSTYKVVVATAIGRQNPKHGMLTIDSTDKSQLTDDDWPILQSVGGMLAASYRIAALVEELENAKAAADKRPTLD